MSAMVKVVIEGMLGIITRHVHLLSSDDDSDDFVTWTRGGGDPPLPAEAAPPPALPGSGPHRRALGQQSLYGSSHVAIDRSKLANARLRMVSQGNWVCV